MADKRSADELAAIAQKASAYDWLLMCRATEMSHAELEDDNMMMLVACAYFIEKQSGPGAKVEHWLNAPLEDVIEYVNLDTEEDEDEEEVPKVSPSTKTSGSTKK